MHPHVHCSVIYNSQAGEAAHVAVSKRVDKNAVIPIHHGIGLGHKKEQNLTICDHIHGSRGCYAKLNTSVRERQVLYDFTYLWNLKNNVKKQTKQKRTHWHREQTDGKGVRPWVKGLRSTDL